MRPALIHQPTWLSMTDEEEMHPMLTVVAPPRPCWCRRRGGCASGGLRARQRGHQDSASRPAVFLPEARHHDRAAGGEERERGETGTMAAEPQAKTATTFGWHSVLLTAAQRRQPASIALHARLSTRHWSGSIAASHTMCCRPLCAAEACPGGAEEGSDQRRRLFLRAPAAERRRHI